MTQSIVLPFTGFYESPWVPNLKNPEDYKPWTIDFAKAYTEGFNELLEEEDMDVGLTFEEVESPREYNFVTDRIFAKIEHPERLDFKQATMTKIAKERFTSGPGFISHYDPDWTTWGPTSTWDHNQLETALLAAITDAGWSSVFELENQIVDEGNLYELAYQYELEEDDDE